MAKAIALIGRPAPRAAPRPILHRPSPVCGGRWPEGPEGGHGHRHFVRAPIRRYAPPSPADGGRQDVDSSSADGGGEERVSTAPKKPSVPCFSGDRRR